MAIDLWQWKCRNLGEEFNSNFGNEVAENEGEKKIVTTKFWNWRKEDLGRKLEEKKKELWQLICGNGIAKMERKKNCGNWFVAMLLPKWKGKKL